VLFWDFWMKVPFHHAVGIGISPWSSHSKNFISGFRGKELWRVGGCPDLIRFDTS
jgi:hypothetical protein